MKDTVKIINPKQAMLYMKHGLKCNCYYSNEKIVYEFDKESSRKLFTLWLNRELN